MEEKQNKINYLLTLKKNINDYFYQENNTNNIKKLIFDYIDNELYNCCEHLFIVDYIDIDPEKSQIIHYCCKCYMTKRQ